MRELERLAAVVVRALHGGSGICAVDLGGGDTRANQVPIDRALWHDLFPHLGWIIDRIPDDGRGDWFEILKLRDWSKGRVAIIGDAANAQPPFLGQGGGCSMMSALSLAHFVAREGDVIRGVAAWTHRERKFTEWVQTVAYWYGQLAFAPPALRNAAFRLIASNAFLKNRTILVAARRMPTGTEAPASARVATAPEGLRDQSADNRSAISGLPIQAHGPR